MRFASAGRDYNGSRRPSRSGGKEPSAGSPGRTVSARARAHRRPTPSSATCSSASTRIATASERDRHGPLNFGKGAPLISWIRALVSRHSAASTPSIVRTRSDVRLRARPRVRAPYAAIPSHAPACRPPAQPRQASQSVGRTCSRASRAPPSAVTIDELATFLSLLPEQNAHAVFDAF